MNTVIKHMENGLLINEQKNETELKNLIEFAVKNVDKLKNIKNNARKTSLKFDKAITMKEETKIYRTILNKHLKNKNRFN